MDKRIIDYPEAYELEEDDYLILESVNGGTCKILAKPLEPIHLVVTSIEAVYVQSGVVKDTDSLDTLRPDLTVTAYYNDGSSEVVTDYDLSGSLEVGTSTITASYRGKSDSFDVTVSSSITYLYKWDFTQSLTDEIQGKTATLQGSATFTQGTGVVIARSLGVLNIGDNRNGLGFQSGRTYEIDFASMTKRYNEDHRLFCSAAKTGFTWNHSNSRWQVYDDIKSSWRNYTTTSNDVNIFNGKTAKIIISADGQTTDIYANDTLIYSGASLQSGQSDNDMRIGSTNKGYIDMTITGVRIYANQ